MKKNQNGVTLIALAVTIIVMLILAGVTMATLTGDNGIITQSRRTAAANTEGTVKEKMQTAFNSVIIQVNMDRAGTEAYIAQDHINDYVAVIKDSIGSGETKTFPTSVSTEKAVADLTTKKYNVYVVGNNKIKIDYTDTTFNLAKSDSVNEKKSLYPFLSATITFDVNEVTYEAPVTHALK